MKIEIVQQELSFSLYGFSGIVKNEDYGATGVPLMDEMWRVVKGLKLENKGINVWVYDSHVNMFAGVELSSTPPKDSKLENRTIQLKRYAYWKHVGSYSRLKDVNTEMRKQLAGMSIAYRHPCLEIYGHWSQDESKLETEILWAIS